MKSTRLYPQIIFATVLSTVILLMTGCSGAKEVESQEVSVTIDNVEQIGSYTGAVEKKIPNGSGKITFASDSGEWTYEGAFSQGSVTDGKVSNMPITITICDGDYTGAFNGSVKDGKLNGSGVFEESAEENAVEYDGEFSNGSISGSGKVSNLPYNLTLEDNEYDGIYNGDTNEGLPNGTGTFDYQDDDKYFNYNGTWADGKMSGDGNLKTNEFVVHFTDKDREGIFDGQTVDGVPVGEGTFSAVNDDGVSYEYVGMWKDGLFDGEGTQTFDTDNYCIRKGNFKSGEYRPTPLEFYTSIGSSKDQSYTISEKSQNFMKNNEKLFLNYTDEIPEDLFESDFKYEAIAKNSSNFGDKLIKVTGLKIFQIGEEDRWGYSATFALAYDSNYKVYYINLLGKAEDVYEGDSITLIALPLDYSTYISTAGEKIWAIYAAGVTIVK